MRDARRVGAVRLSFLTIAIVVALAACTSTASSGSQTPTGRPSVSQRPISMASARHCPVTVPQGVTPAEGTYRNGQLRVGGLWPDGVIAAGPAYVDARGRVEMKFPWWRTVDGRLRITGRRLDGPAPPLSSYVP